MTTANKYTLNDFNEIVFNGFVLELPEETMRIISELALEVGSPTYVKTPIFQKRVNPMKGEVITASATPRNDASYKKKKGNKNVEVFNDEEWETMKSFQATKIEKKAGLDLELDSIRTNLNKMSDKNYVDFKSKIIETIDKIVSENMDDENMMNVSKIIFDIASLNRFYSKMYANFYTELFGKYDFMRNIFEKNLNEYTQLFDIIEYVDPKIDYDKFCRINQDNEKRKSLMSFFINLMINGVINKDKIIFIIRNLLIKINEFISIEDKKNEVDELTENISILFKMISMKSVNEENSEIIKQFKNIIFTCEDESIVIDGQPIIEVIKKLAHSKTKQYLSLTNKSIFKFMDMIEM